MSQSLQRAMALLDELGQGERSLDDLAATVGVHKSTILRLLQTLEAGRMVTHDSKHRYRLGTKLFELANRSLEGRDIRTEARPHLQELNELTRQTVHLAILESGAAIYIDKIDATEGMRMYSRVGFPAPLHCTAVGKVLVAAQPAARRRELAEAIEYSRFTERTILDSATYLDVLETVARQGFAEDNEEHESFINCIAVPVRNGTGDVVAALSMSVPDRVLDHQQVLAQLPRLIDTATAISTALGWSPSLTRKAEK